MIPELPEPVHHIMSVGKVIGYFSSAQLEQYARDYHAAMMGKPVAFKCGSYFYPYPSEDDYCDMAEKHVLLYEPKVTP